MYRITIFVLLVLSTLAVTSLANISYKYTKQIQNKAYAQDKILQSNMQDGETNANSWLLLLPVIAIPLLFTFSKSEDDETIEEDVWEYRQNSVGMKGGQSESLL